ncbi:ABC-type multidrug transport system, ATPase and permease component [Psychroflexus salarius]|uniref:ABC-type multidrug transport system, ATPase and permease component n=1 Tax=Psychroflexus salarius TaxID=1155689 RepID=A0A1M4V015_9FLAO|nr:ABC transporter transmembrane domain-containing protein [Psychroflexus salarius]SHE62341.1 ABC-type multidrug transport system, ATPase and permease component [Psychroflexus salarius]
MAKRKPQNDLPKAKLSASNLKRSLRLFTYIGPHKWKLIIGMIFLGLTGVTALLFPKLMGDLIQTADFSVDDINRMGLILLGLFTAQAVFSFFRVVLFVNVTENMLSTIRQDTYNNLIKMPMQFFSSRQVNELNSRVAADISQIQDTFTTGLAEFLRQSIIVVGGIVALFFTSVELSLLMLATIPVFAIIAVFFGKFIKKLSKAAQDQVAESNTIVGESLQGISNVKSFTNEWFEIKRYKKSVNKIKAIAIKGGLARGAFSSFIIFCIFGAIVLLVWQAVKLQNTGDLSQADLVTFILYTIFVGASIGGLPIQYAQIQKAIGATERVFDLIDEIPESIETSTETKKIISGQIEFNQVNFAYPSRAQFPVLSSVSFKANSGETIAIAGPSGSGKSTLASLVLRFYEPQSGEILFDGKPASNYGLHELRQQMAIVPQDVLLFGGSIFENIAYGKPNASKHEVIEAAKSANAHEFIMGFPDQYNTLVGERGVQLSGGQRQRVAIARAVLKNPKLLILDEATSSLDSESEKLVQEALDQLMKNRTSIVIAHRLSTIKNADQILVLENGQIIEKGTHEDLLQQENGLYKKLSSIQFDA